MTGVTLTYRRPLVVGGSKGMNSPLAFSYIVGLIVNPRQRPKDVASLTKEKSPS